MYVAQYLMSLDVLYMKLVLLMSMEKSLKLRPLLDDLINSSNSRIAEISDELFNVR
ncbi:unnamed protein product [Rotaria sp. Silwood1]|nr:unnamed protein product [Rotaria sp. Silwood1]